jgi:hypothetical protein
MNHQPGIPRLAARSRLATGAAVLFVVWLLCMPWNAITIGLDVLFIIGYVALELAGKPRK